MVEIGDGSANRSLSAIRNHCGRCRSECPALRIVETDGEQIRRPPALGRGREEDRGLVVSIQL